MFNNEPAFWVIESTRQVNRSREQITMNQAVVHQRLSTKDKRYVHIINI